MLLYGIEQNQYMAAVDVRGLKLISECMYIHTQDLQYPNTCMPILYKMCSDKQICSNTVGRINFEDKNF